MNARARIRSLDAFTVGCFVVVLGLFLYAFVYTPSAPLEFRGGDMASPAVAHPGDTVYVRRNFVVKTGAVVRITRRMMSGDCSKERGPDQNAGVSIPFKGCVILDLQTTETYFGSGEYREIWRPHVIPNTATPGTWRLEFFMVTRNPLGRAISYPLPPVTLEVIK